MSAEELKQQLKTLQRILDDLDRRRDGIVRAIEGIMQAVDSEENAARQTTPTMSLRAAVIQVLRESEGSTIHVKVILSRVQELGAYVSSKDKISRVDLAVVALKKQGFPVERDGVRVWRYLGGEQTPIRRGKRVVAA